MNRRIALGIIWGMVAWNGIALIGYVTGTALGAVAAPLGILVGLAVAVIAARPHRVPARTRPLKLDADRA
jgi:hypothetical protein